MKHILLPFLSAVLFLLAGCLTPTPNLRVWVCGNVKATGTIQSNGDTVYHSICIGTDTLPYDGRQAFAIRLMDGTVLSSEDFSEPTIRAVAQTKNQFLINVNNFGDERFYSFDGVTFIYRDDRLALIDATWMHLPEKTYAPAIAQSPQSTFYPLPVPGACLVEIFGTPDEIRDSFVW